MRAKESYDPVSLTYATAATAGGAMRMKSVGRCRSCSGW